MFSGYFQGVSGFFRVFSGCFSLCPFRVCPLDPFKFRVAEIVFWKGPEAVLTQHKASYWSLMADGMTPLRILIYRDEPLTPRAWQAGSCQPTSRLTGAVCWRSGNTMTDRLFLSKTGTPSCQRPSRRERLKTSCSCVSKRRNNIRQSHFCAFLLARALPSSLVFCGSFVYRRTIPKQHVAKLKNGGEKLSISFLERTEQGHNYVIHKELWIEAFGFKACGGSRRLVSQKNCPQAFPKLPLASDSKVLLRKSFLSNRFSKTASCTQNSFQSAKSKRGRREGDGKKKNVTTICDKRHDNLRHVTTICDILWQFPSLYSIDIKRHKTS